MHEDLLAALKQLLPGQFDEVVYKYGLPPEYLPDKSSQVEKALLLVRHAQQQADGSERLQTCIAQVQNRRRAVRSFLPPALFALLLSALGLGLWWPTQENPAQIPQTLAGSIRDSNGAPLPGVSVALPAYGVSVSSDEFGQFRLQVEAPPQAEVELLAQKDGYRVHEQYATLGNTGLSFSLQKK